ncbi:MAG: aminomethyl-transferring glycine dehydrogenase subunit GcvPA [Erysipelotrichaceae bacterium]|nr:aminomethyl-transferring glycine dehydrogenase subunit GcvPA [Erysipelotrichaceae bacterium]
MSKYIVNSAAEQQEMLDELGYGSFEELFRKAGVKVQAEVDLPAGVTEYEAYEDMRNLAKKNRIFKHVFRGAGSYKHYIPSVVKNIVSRNEFVTAYTPYQAEVSQGVLQGIFEYQSEMCELTGMDVSNASVYDGGSAAAEAVMMCVDKKHHKILLSKGINPQYRAVVKTYHQFSEDIVIEEFNGDFEVDDDTAGIFVQNPDFYGNIIDVAAVKEKAGKAKVVVIANPLALAMIEAPGHLGADIVVGEGQQLGMPMSFGGPYLGFMTTKKDMVRKLPGRIVGQTTDKDGKRCYTLTLQAREQHIRREKASSSICSNEALCAFTAAVYLAAVGPEGLYEVADTSFQMAHYMADRLSEIGFETVNKGPFFNEFVSECPIDAGELFKHLYARDVLPGLLLSNNRILWCATEVNSKEEIDWLIDVIKEVL